MGVSPGFELRLDKLLGSKFQKESMAGCTPAVCDCTVNQGVDICGLMNTAPCLAHFFDILLGLCHKAHRGMVRVRITRYSAENSLLQPVFHLELPELAVSSVRQDLWAQDRIIFKDDVRKGPVVVRFRLAATFREG